MLRGVAAVAEVIVGDAVGGRPVIGGHLRAVAAIIAADPVGLGGGGDGQGGDDEGDFRDGVHSLLVVVVEVGRGVGGVCRRFVVRSPAQPSPHSSQSAGGFLQVIGMRGLPKPLCRRVVRHISMKPKAQTTAPRIELGRHIVADPRICGGQPTFKGTRIMVWIVLEQLEDGLTWTEIVGEWDGKVSEEAIAEAIAIAPLVEKHEPFRGFDVDARREPADAPEAVVA